MERLVPGRWPTLKPPTRQELKATTVVTLALEEVVAKVRSGPPKDEPEDYALDIWAGVVPTRITLDAPESDPALKSGIAIPDNLSRIRSEEHTSELQSLMRISYAVSFLNKKTHKQHITR